MRHYSSFLRHPVFVLGGILGAGTFLPAAARAADATILITVDHKDSSLVTTTAAGGNRGKNNPPPDDGSGTTPTDPTSGGNPGIPGGPGGPKGFGGTTTTLGDSVTYTFTVQNLTKFNAVGLTLEYHIYNQTSVDDGKNTTLSVADITDDVTIDVPADSKITVDSKPIPHSTSKTDPGRGGGFGGRGGGSPFGYNDLVPGASGLGQAKPGYYILTARNFGGGTTAAKPVITQVSVIGYYIVVKIDDRELYSTEYPDGMRAKMTKDKNADKPL